ncbi:hypothetical protein [Rugamonas aquatica]|uniref:Uncharacterized protein n=1 Tax=Rugamonas aquatica TaxID=2743357 RepID=A0A6A7N6L6_9BURK|nr:hypothetical protein [Rugamonas aquatica]MQA40676.1 hypothetical protein [Rugamonas aquatica]
MLTLSEAQWQALQLGEAHQFLTMVADHFLASRPDMLALPGREAVRARMKIAHDFAARLGFTSAPHIIRLMYLGADAPTAFDDPAFARYLLKPGATPEQRLDDLDAIMRHKLKGNR